jgi:hypothetical protein
MAEVLEAGWGSGVALGAFAPSLSDDAHARQWWGRAQRWSASPGAIRQLIESYMLIDVRPALPLVGVPTLVLHRRDDRMVAIELAREIRDAVPGARMVEFPGSDHLLPTTNWPDIIDVLEEFVIGHRPAPEPSRFLATVVFTDIVDSTGRLREVGDERWTRLLDLLDQGSRSEVERFGGCVVHGTGDGVLAVFDGPTWAIRAAVAIAQSAGLGLSVRGGLHRARSSSGPTATSRASPCTWPPASPRSPGRTRSWSRAPRPTWSPGRACASPTRASTRSRAWRDSTGSTASSAPARPPLPGRGVLRGAHIRVPP